MPNLGGHPLERESRRISRQLSSATPKKLKRLTENNQLAMVKDLLKQSKKDIDQLLIQNWLDNELDGELEGDGAHRPASFTDTAICVWPPRVMVRKAFEATPATGTALARPASRVEPSE